MTNPNSNTSDIEAAKSKFSFWTDASFKPTMLMVLVLFSLKFEQQGAVSSVPYFTREYGWRESTMGLFLTTMGVAVIPVNILMGGASKYVKDRHQCLLSLGLCVIGGGLVAFLSPNPTEILKWQYFSAFVTIYVATVVMEGAAMSLMSKVTMPKCACTVGKPILQCWTLCL